MDWTRKQRYRNYDSATKQELEHLKSSTNNSIWRQTYHVQPIYGLLNDPNGFSFFNGQYHLFYQWFPLGAVHGLKHWYHTTSTDLINFTNIGVGLKPEFDHESHGIFSGCGFVYQEQLYFFYTGNKRDKEWKRFSSQCVAIMDKHGHFTKLAQPVIMEQPAGYTTNFRDPKVLEVKNKFYMLVGAQRKNLTGCVLVYCSDDLLNWTWKGELQINLDEFGFMWECPDLFELDNKYVLLISPQGLSPNEHFYNNRYHSVALIGDLDIDKLIFTIDNIQELDSGFDFYAPQTTCGEDNRRLLVGWMGIPDIRYPSDKDNWANCLTIIRELSLQNGRVIQKPVREFIKKRNCSNTINLSVNGMQDLPWIHFKSGEILITMNNISSVESGINFCVGDKGSTTIKVDWKNQRIILDRSKTGQTVAPEYGEQRMIPYHQNNVTLQMFLDTSSVEIFINDGEFIFTSRLFPANNNNHIQLFSNGGECTVDLKQWNYL